MGTICFLPKKKHYLLLLFTLIYVQGFTQEGVSVNHHTGTLAYAVPIFRSAAGPVPVTVNLVYTGSGIKVDDDPGAVGMNWTLMAGGALSRAVRGLPDDYRGQAQDARRGWLEPGISEQISDFQDSPANSTDCGAYSSQWDLISSWNYKYDTEPDLFHINAPGISGQFVFDNNKQIRFLSHNNSKVEYTRGADGQIIEFRVTNDNGVTYIFNELETADRITYGYHDVKQLKTETELYKDLVSFTSSWKLSEILKNGEKISYKYFTGIKKTVLSLRYYVPKFDEGYWAEPNTRNDTRVTKTLSSIEYDAGKVVFGYKGVYLNSFDSKYASQENDPVTNRHHLLNSIDIYAKWGPDYVLSKKFALDYLNGVSSNNGYGTYRYFLKTVSEVDHAMEKDCFPKPPYQFSYKGITPENAHNIPIPSPGSNAQDAWGYLNSNTSEDKFPKLYIYPNKDAPNRIRLTPLPSHKNGGKEIVLAGADRSTDPLKILLGTLERVILPAGGSIRFDFQPHDYFDSEAETDMKGGGIRIHKVTTRENIANPGLTATKEYLYTGANNKSSGRLIHMPQFAIPTTFSRTSVYGSQPGDWKTYESLQQQVNAGSITETELWDLLLVRAERSIDKYDITDNDNLGYAIVTEKLPGKGRAVYEFTLPATWGEDAGSDWGPTTIRFAKKTDPTTGTCPVSGILDRGAYTFPYTAAANFGFERGLLQHLKQYNEKGDLVYHQELDYIRTSPQEGIVPVYGLSMEAIATYISSQQESGTVTGLGPEVFAFGKYKVMTQVHKLVSKETEHLYTQADIARAVITTQTYTYADGLLKKKSVSNSDGSELSTYFRYAKDYPVSGGVNEETQMLQRLVDQNQAVQLVESYQTLKAGAGAERITGAQLFKFSSFGTAGVYLHKLLAIRTGQPITDFQPSSVSGNTLTHDSRYIVESTVQGVDGKGKPLGFIGKGSGSLVQSTHWGYGDALPVAEFVGAKADEAVYSSFESAERNGFTRVPEVYEIGGRTGQYSFLLRNSHKLTKEIAFAASENYRFSAWVKAGAAGNLAFIIKSPAGSELQTHSVPYQDTSGKWVLLELTLQVNNLLSNALVEVSKGSGGDVYVDDVLFMPDDAFVTTSTYKPTVGKTSVTDARGISRFMEYDNFGFLTAERDHEGNIKAIYKRGYWEEKDGYNSKLEVIQADFNPMLYTGEPVTFKVTPFTCEVDEITYEWNFGDGSLPTQGTSTIQHSFHLAPHESSRNFTVKVKLMHPTLGPSYKEVSVNITKKPLTVAICVSGPRHVSIVDVVVDAIMVEDPCANREPTMDGTYYKVSGLSDCAFDSSQPIRYTWQISHDNGRSWITVRSGTGAAYDNYYAEINYHGYGVGEYLIRCEVNAGSCNGASEPFRFTVERN